jgi:hypothetical protein
MDKGTKHGIESSTGYAGWRGRALKGFYQQADGKFRLDIEGGYKLPSEIEGLTSALGKERQRAGELKWSEITDKATGELRTLDDLGFTLSGKKKD